MPRILFGGGLNQRQNPDLQECAEGQNFELALKQTKFIPRAPLDWRGTAPNGGAVTGLMQLVKRDGTETTLVVAGDTVYRWNGLTFTSVGTVPAGARLRDTYWSLWDILVITDLDKSAVLKQWNGTTLTDLTTGLASPLYAKYSAVFNSRVWLANVRTTADTPHLIVASAFENPFSFDTAKRARDSTFSTGLEAFYLPTPDLKPVNGLLVHRQQLIVSTLDGRLFRLTGTSSLDYAWTEYFSGSAALGDESLVDTGNDVIYARKGGNIDRLSRVELTGDTRADDLSRFVLPTVQDRTPTLAVYDQSNQKALFFYPGKVLVLFKDLLGQPLSPWSVYTTQDPSEFATQAARYLRRPGTTTYTVLFGDAAGRILDLNGGGIGDAGHPLTVSRTTRRITDQDYLDPVTRRPTGNPRANLLRGSVIYRRVGECDLSITLDWQEEYNISRSVLTLQGPPPGDVTPYFGAAWFNDDTWFGQGSPFANRISAKAFSTTGKGRGYFLTAAVEALLPFQIDEIDL